MLQVITGKRKMEEAEGTVWNKRRISWSFQALNVLKVRFWLATSVRKIHTSAPLLDRELQHSSIQDILERGSVSFSFQ